MTHHTEEHQTGTRDVTYDIVSVLYHALQGAETYSMYFEDAQSQGDNETASFFQDLINEEKRRADRAKNLLAQRISQSSG